jgi:hypothetical protein
MRNSHGLVQSLVARAVPNSYVQVAASPSSSIQPESSPWTFTADCIVRAVDIWSPVPACVRALRVADVNADGNGDLLYDLTSSARFGQI